MPIAKPLVKARVKQWGNENPGWSMHQAEAFVDPEIAAEFVKLNRKTLLRFARKGLIPAHPITGNKRKKWVFLLSELDAWARAKVNSICDPCRNLGRK